MTRNEAIERIKVMRDMKIKILDNSNNDYGADSLLLKDIDALDIALAYLTRGISILESGE